MDPLELTVLLSRVWGLYMIIAGIMVLVNRRGLMLGIQAMSREKFAEVVTALTVTLGGLFFVVFYQNWSSLPSSILSLIAWVVLLKGLACAFIPEATLAKYNKHLTKKSWYTADGVIAIVIGLYLAGFGFGLW